LLIITQISRISCRGFWIRRFGTGLWNHLHRHVSRNWKTERRRSRCGRTASLSRSSANNISQPPPIMGEGAGRLS
jgi:hypothetical protein